MYSPALRSWLLLPALWLSVYAPATAATIVSGHVARAQGGEVGITFGSNGLGPKAASQVRARLDAKGDFRVELPTVLAPTEATLEHADKTTRLYLTPGDNLRVAFDAENFAPSLRFTGVGAAANTYLSQSLLRFDEKFEAQVAARARSGSLRQLQQVGNAHRQQRLAFLKAYAAAHSLPAAFQAYARQSIAFEWASQQLRFPGASQDATGVAAPLPAGYYDFLAVVRPAQDSALAANASSYLAFVDAYIATQLAPAGTLPTAPAAALVAAVDQQFGPGRSHDLVLARFLASALRDRDATELATLMPAFLRATRDSVLARTVRAQYQRRLLLAAGRKAPGVTVRDHTGQPVSLSDFKGKVVYLDFWASWCGPCMAQVPANAALKQNFAGKDVVFLYISIDNNEASWKKALAANPLLSASGVHTWDKGFQGNTPSAYQVDTIPAYFIIDRNGRLANGCAPRPGEAAVAALNKALAQ